mmetsp:Transcript_21406/g.51062  ORF Transcript_21406/g.51062 Transcript_21406/m.51062 type:complete len:216 (+) Transcript_21406:177-824(+)
MGTARALADESPAVSPGTPLALRLQTESGPIVRFGFAGALVGQSHRPLRLSVPMVGVAKRVTSASGALSGAPKPLQRLLRPMLSAPSPRCRRRRCRCISDRAVGGCHRRHRERAGRCSPPGPGNRSQDSPGLSRSRCHRSSHPAVGAFSGDLKAAHHSARGESPWWTSAGPLSPSAGPLPPPCPRPRSLPRLHTLPAPPPRMGCAASPVGTVLRP